MVAELLITRYSSQKIQELSLWERATASELPQLVVLLVSLLRYGWRCCFCTGLSDELIAPSGMRAYMGKTITFSIP